MPVFQSSFMGITLGYAGKYHGLIWGTALFFMGNATVRIPLYSITDWRIGDRFRCHFAPQV